MNEESEGFKDNFAWYAESEVESFFDCVAGYDEVLINPRSRGASDFEAQRGRKCAYRNASSCTDPEERYFLRQIVVLREQAVDSVPYLRWDLKASGGILMVKVSPLNRRLSTSLSI